MMGFTLEQKIYFLQEDVDWEYFYHLDRLIDALFWANDEERKEMLERLDECMVYITGKGDE